MKYQVLKDGDAIWCWVEGTQQMYSHNAEADTARLHERMTLEMFLRFNPEAKLVSDTDKAPAWLVGTD